MLNQTSLFFSFLKSFLSKSKVSIDKVTFLFIIPVPLNLHLPAQFLRANLLKSLKGTYPNNFTICQNPYILICFYTYQVYPSKYQNLGTTTLGIIQVKLKNNNTNNTP